MLGDPTSERHTRREPRNRHKGPIRSTVQRRWFLDRVEFLNLFEQFQVEWFSPRKQLRCSQPAAVRTPRHAILGIEA
jgi:hypothetical protein